MSAVQQKPLDRAILQGCFFVELISELGIRRVLGSNLALQLVFSSCKLGGQNVLRSRLALQLIFSYARH